MEKKWEVEFQAGDDPELREIPFGMTGILYFRASDNFDEACRIAKNRLSAIGFDGVVISRIEAVD